MSTIEEVKAVERAMKKAQDALVAYVERQSKGHDLDLHRRLAAELKALRTITTKWVLH